MDSTTQADPKRSHKPAALRWGRFEDPELETAFSTWRRDFHIRGSCFVMSLNLLLVLAGGLIDVQSLPRDEMFRLMPYRLACAGGLVFLIVFLQHKTSTKETPASPLLVANTLLLGVTWGLCFYSHIAQTYTMHTGHNDSMIIVPAFALLALIFLPRTKLCLLLMALVFHLAMAFIHNLPEVPAWFAMQSSFSLFIFIIAGITGHFWRHSTERRLFDYACREQLLDR